MMSNIDEKSFIQSLEFQNPTTTMTKELVIRIPAKLN